MSELLIKQCELNGKIVDILIKGNRIAKIADEIIAENATTICGKGKAALPPFYNTHNHAAMTILRSYADDLELFTWLSEHIWPIEAKMSEEDVYIGTKLACLEMIKSGTVFFNDSYWSQMGTVRAVEELGMRAAIGLLLLEGPDGEILDTLKVTNKELMDNRDSFSDRIILTVSPHAIYTVSEKNLKVAAELSAEYNMPVHLHLAETAKEVEDCKAQHNGMTPVEYIASCGLLNERLIAAHCVHMNDNDIKLMAESKAIIAHNPCSNMKLNSGSFRWKSCIEAGCIVTVGTDGCASNNNMSMIDEVKFAALSAKREANSPLAAPAEEVFKASTQVAAQAMGIDAGVIEEGKLADLILVNLDNSRLIGNNLVANMVYSADSACIDTVICDGALLMNSGIVPNEAQIIAEARECINRLTKNI